MLGFGDPVADAIGMLRPRTVIGPSFRASGDWALSFDRFPYVKVGGVVRGRAWLILEGQEPVPVEEGDTFLMGNPPPYVLAGERDGRPKPAALLWGEARPDVVTIGPATDEHTYICTGQLAFDHRSVSVLTDLLPPVVIVRATDPHGRPLAQLIELLAAEVEAAAPGGVLAENHLAQVLLVYMLRAHASQSDRPTGWLRALNDDGIGAALRAVHADVAHSWSLTELATISHMSRSAFAEAFKSQVGIPPVEYVIQWRMSLARDALAHDTASISELARATGYLSESAFSTAFRRVVGSSPAQFRKQARQTPFAAAEVG